jgi:hypothetical protein
LKSLELLEVSIALVAIRFHILFSGCNIVKIFDYQVHYFLKKIFCFCAALEHLALQTI